MLGVGATLTIAAWTDQENSKATITAGSFAIESQVSNHPWASNNPDAVEVPLGAAGLYPGQDRAAWVQIRTGPGSVQGTVSLTGIVIEMPTATSPNTDLRDALRAWVFPVGTTAACTPGAATGAGDAITNLPASAAVPQGLAANGAGTVTYCIVVRLPTTAPSTAQGGSVTPTWTFTGTTP